MKRWIDVGRIAAVSPGRAPGLVRGLIRDRGHGRSRGLALLLGLAMSVLCAGSAAGISTGGSEGSEVVGGGTSLEGLEILCERAGEGGSDCSQIRLPALPAAVPVDFDFDLGVKAIADGLDLSIYSGGDVFVLGAIAAIDSVTLHSEQIAIYGDGSGPLDGSRSIIAPGLDLRDLVLDADLTVVSPGDLSYCACVEASAGGGVRLNEAGGISLAGAAGLPVASGGSSGKRSLSAAALSGGVASAIEPSGTPTTPPGLWISRSGDVYVDLSMVVLERLSIKALGAIVVVDVATTPVPEPGTALLLGLGLGLLGLARGRR